jgi:hypothetical protein
MSDRLAINTPLEKGRTYWIAVPPDGKPIMGTVSDDLITSNMQLPFFPLGLDAQTHLGGVKVLSDGMTVGSVAQALCEWWGVSDVVIADAGALSDLLGLVVTGIATNVQLYQLRDEVLELGGKTIGWTATIVEWLPWIIAGTAALGLAVVLVMEVRS